MDSQKRKYIKASEIAKGESKKSLSREFKTNTKSIRRYSKSAFVSVKRKLMALWSGDDMNIS